MSRLTVAEVRGLRFSSTWLSSRTRARSASAAAYGPAGIVSLRSMRLPVSGSSPAHTVTWKEPLGSRRTRPRRRVRGPFRAVAMPQRIPVRGRYRGTIPHCELATAL